MRIIFLCLFLLANAAATELLQLYLKEGIKAVEGRLESQLADSSAWSKALMGQDLRFGYYEKDAMIAVVDKTAQKIKLFSWLNGQLKEIFAHEIITGLMGDKQVSGDLKTPVGSYESLKQFKPNDAYYGPWAFALDYPNHFDLSMNKTGNGIWIHGYPIYGDIRYDPKMTRGCVVLKNDVLIDFWEQVKDKRLIVLINEAGQKEAKNEEVAQILALLYAWKRAWTNSDLDAYLSFYSKDFKKFDGSDFSSFKKHKQIIFARKEDKKIKFSNISLSPYPNTLGKELFKLSFHEDYYTKNYQYKGDKFLYLEKEGTKYKILVER